MIRRAGSRPVAQKAFVRQSRLDIMTLIGRDNVKRRLFEVLTTRCRLTGCAKLKGEGTFHGHFENARPTTICGGSNIACQGEHET